MSGTWPMVLADVVGILALTSFGFLLAETLTNGTARWPAYWAIGGVTIFVAAALPLRYFLMAQRNDAEERERVLVLDGQRREFDARLTRALEMADDEPSTLVVAARAFVELAPTIHIELLLADSSQAHLVRSVAHHPEEGLTGCTVSTPRGCPAVRTGHPLTFEDDQRLDACPHLRDRGAAHSGAVCVPVSIMGSNVGVVHAVHRAGERPDERAILGLSTIAQHLGSRIGMLAAMSKSQMQANTDPLTGLLNRRSLENDVRELVSDDRPFALVLADLDHFKRLNDTFGHDTGDRALRLFARTVGKVMREGDLVCRFGGEEFVVVLPGLGAVEAVAVFDRVRLELEVAVADGRTPSFTVSAGVVDTTESLTLDEMINLADGLLRQAKRNGRNQVICSGINETARLRAVDPAVPDDEVRLGGRATG